jgi:hypothetical protein
MNHDARGNIFLTKKQDGGMTDVQTHQIDSISETGVAHRIRFWHSDYPPQEYPDYYDYPIEETEPPRKTVDRNSLLNGMERYIENEKLTQKRKNRGNIEEKLDSSPDSYLTLTSKGDVSTKVFKFSFELPEDFDGNGFEYLVGEHGLYEDGVVLLAHPESTTKPDDMPLEAVVEDIKGTKVILRIESEVEDFSRVHRYLSKKRRGFKIAPLLNPTPYDREMAAVQSISQDEDKLSVLSGERDLSFGDPRASSETYDTELNQEQQTAVKLSLLSEGFFCLHGPPGTGKTRALVEIIRRASSTGQRVLVCADSNQAADNLLVGSTSSDTEGTDESSLHAYGQHGEENFSIRRVNADRSHRDLVKEHYSRGKRNESVDADVVVSTNNSAADLPSYFDLAVIDEATQSTLTSSCIPISKADKFVLAGDHKQLPPYSASEGPSESRYGSSLFEYLYAEGGVYEDVGVQLKTQYRMHRDIMYFPNRRFYSRSLRCGREVENVPGFEAVRGYDLGGKVFEDGRESKYNPTEVKMVLVLLEKLVSSGLSPGEIAVITPYDAQKKEVLQAIPDMYSGVSVDTVDSFQGGEREAIVISMVRSNEYGGIGFLGRPEDGPRRLNVAITRAKQFCGIIGDWKTLTAEREGKCSGLYQDLHSYLIDTGRMQDVDAKLLEMQADDISG